MEIAAGLGAGGRGWSAVGEEGRDGRAETVEGIARCAEMIIAGQGPRPGGETQVTAVVTAPDHGDGGNNNEREGAGPIAMNAGLLNAATSAYHNMKQLHNVR
jgi:hypothetical protein